MGSAMMVATATAALLLAGLPAAPAAADPLAQLPVPAVEVTSSDSSMRDTAREVVVLDERTATPRMHKYRAASAAAAARLAAALDARPGLVASRNATLRADAQGTATALENEPEGAAQDDMLMIGAPDAWPSSTGAGVTVAILDTGVDPTNPDLAGRVLPELNLIPGAVSTNDLNGHGTLVASIVAAGLNAYGIAGVAPGATILPVAALDPTGYGDISTVAAAIVAAVDAGARVINMSLGGPERDRVLDAACAYAHAKGVVLVAAAGNSRTSGNKVQYPAASPYVLAVASVDATGTPSWFSNTGSYVDIAAPGENITGAAPGGGTDVMDGTSAAAPHVSGAIALAAAANPRLSADELIDSVVGSALRVAGPGRDDSLGYGVVRADLAVARALSKVPPAAPITGVRKVTTVDAAPEPIRRGRKLAVIVSVAALYSDGQWLPDPGGTSVIVEFRKSGKRAYQPVATVPTISGGFAVTQVTARKSGRWRARILLSDGSVAVGKSDAVTVK